MDISTDEAEVQLRQGGTVVEGTPEKPGRPRHVWEIESVTPLDRENDFGLELFYLVQRVAGAWVQSPITAHEVYYVPRNKNLPPIQRLTLSYLDSDGSIQNELRR